MPRNLTSEEKEEAYNVNTFFHYCSTATALEIIKNKTLRFSSLDHMNDPHECRYFLRVALQHLDKVPSLSESQRKGIREYFSEEYLSDIDHLNEQVFANVYCFCMSIRSDDLSQWRGYGDDGFGVAIGFNKFQLNGFHARDSRIQLRQVNYSEGDLIEGLREWKIPNHSHIGIEKDLTPMYAFFQLMRFAPGFKQHAYKDEKEWRLVFSPPGLVPDSDNDKALGVTFGATLRGRSLVPYYDIAYHKPLITEIRLGPNVSNHSELALRLFLESREMGGIKVERSEIGYRSGR